VATSLTVRIVTDSFPEAVFMRIKLDGVSKSYKKIRALDRVSLTIEPGQIVVVLGANGAGKTTLLRTLAGIVVPDSGTTSYDGEIFKRSKIDLRKRLHFIPDFPTVFVGMKVAGHIAMALRLYGKEIDGLENRVVQILEDFDLLPLVDSTLGTLSRGQGYKAVLAGLIAINPDLWLLDEPLASGMDPHGIQSFKTYAREAAKNGSTVVNSTQILEIAENFSDRICILDRGSVHAFDDMASLRRGTMESQDGVLAGIFEKLRANN